MSLQKSSWPVICQNLWSEQFITTSYSFCDITQLQFKPNLARHFQHSHSTDNSLDYLNGARVLLEKLILPQLVKKFPAFCLNQRFITLFTRACDMSPNQICSVHATPPYFFNTRCFKLNYPNGILYAFIDIVHISHNLYILQCG
jgi:hypothetical protein